MQNLHVISAAIPANVTTAFGSTVEQGYVRNIWSIKYVNASTTTAVVTLSTVSGRAVDTDVIPAQNSHYDVNNGIIVANVKQGDQMLAYSTQPVTLVVWYNDEPGSL